MSYKPPYTITPKITNLVAQISEAIGSYYAHENLRLHRVNRIKTIHGTLAIEGNTLSTEQVTAVLEGKPVVAPINEVQCATPLKRMNCSTRSIPVKSMIC